ncbi:terminase TerL endonuclease subunit [Nocardiopsis rhodophaea]|uniref:terminase TerL endonuclease subunit n=1 Tax=Nocardiopsis rhodophaea TaxID=280238 RepID=UPI0031D5FD3D
MAPSGSSPDQVCGWTHDGTTCRETTSHFCVPRADHATGFVEEVLVHTKGTYARKPFLLTPWQRDHIIRPLMGTVAWSSEHGAYVRRYNTAWIEIARKNGKALAVDTPILTRAGWTTMGELGPGDEVHASDGELTRVLWVSERHTRPTYTVRFADGAKLVASDEHKWWVNDRKLHVQRVVTTRELAETLTYGRRGDRRYSVDVPQALQRPETPLPIEPYLLGCWLGDGSSHRAALTCADAEIIARIRTLGQPVKREAGGPYAWTLSDGRRLGRGNGGATLNARLRAHGLLGNKHVPDAYLTASRSQRLELLRGLMDTDGSVNTGPNTPRVEFVSTQYRLADAVLVLARSLGWKATIKESRASLNGRDCGPRWRVAWTAYADEAPFHLTRKARLLAARPHRPTRASTNAITAVEQVEPAEAVCIAIEHPSSVFLAGRSLTPTHNSELLAAVMLYLLVADNEEEAELYGCARDRDQASLVFNVASRMVQLSPVLSRRLRIKETNKRIIDPKTASFYQVIAADAAGALGYNPHGVAADEILAWRKRDLWDAMETGMGSGARKQPLMVAATTAGNDPASFAANMHNEMQRIADQPDRSPHTFVYLRNTPDDADPWDEATWEIANPALGDFLSVEKFRQAANDAKNAPEKENAFRQFRLNQWVRQATRWMPMHLYEACAGDVWDHPDRAREELAGREAWGGLDLSAKFDLTAWCVLLPPEEPGGPVDVLWRFWLPEEALPRLDDENDGAFTRWAQQGWLTVTEGNIQDYDRIRDDIAADGDTFAFRGLDADEWSMWPVINKVADAVGLDPEVGEVAAYKNTYDRMTPGLTEVMALVKTGRFEHHGNPVASFCFDSVEVRRAPYNPDLIRPDKPERDKSGKRIDAVPTAAMAASAWALRGTGEAPRSAYEDRGITVA